MGLGLALLCFGWLVARSSFLIDDAFISFRYARNWADGVGLVYGFAAEAPVEGYSNFLWVALLALAARADFMLETASRVISIGAGVTLVILLHRFLARGLRLGLAATTLGTLALATFPPFTFWCTGGLETALFALLLFAGFALLVGERAPARDAVTGALAGLAALGVALLRPEGFAWIPVLGVVALAHGGRRVRPFLLVSVAGFALFLLWRHAIYDAWLPNTVQAKAGLSGAVLMRGLRSSATYLLLFVTPLLAPLVLLGRGSGNRRAQGAAACLCFAAALAFNTVVGGDWMPMFRFLAPVTPFLAILLALGVERLGGVRGPVLGTLGVALALLPAFGHSLVPRPVRAALYFRTFRTGYETEWARWQRSRENLQVFVFIGKGLAQIAAPGDSMTCGAIGAIGYYSGIEILDRNGLIDRAVAARPAALGARTAGHDKRVPRAYFLDSDPTFFEALFIPDPAVSFERAARILRARIESDGEAALFEHCVPEAHPLRAGDGLPAGARLLVLRRAEPGEASAAWARLGYS